MANAAVEKLKTFGLRQGEKIVVGVAAAILLACVGLLATKEVLPLTPEQLQVKAEQADSNLGRKQEPEAIAAKIEEAGIKDPGFVKIVENQASNTLKPGDYRSRLDWVTPEPGAGLIRDQPDILAPTELYALPGRGGLYLFALNDKGERILDKAAIQTNNGGRRGAPGRPGAEPPAGGAGKSQEQIRRERSFAGKTDAKDKPEEKKAEATPDPDAEGPWKTDTVGKRWVAITGVVDNEKLNNNWLAALKNAAIAFPQFAEVKAERQSRQDDGTWSAWAAVNEDAKYGVIDNMPDEQGSEEYVPEPLRPQSLVDPLPFLRAGYWNGVHVARLVPDEIRNTPDPGANGDPGMMGGRGGRGGRGMGMSMGPGMGMESGGSGMSGASRSGGMGMAGGMGMSGGMGMAGGEDGRGGSPSPGSGPGGPAEEPVVANLEPTLMLRYIDFSVEPNTVYRYRLRLAIKNPNLGHTDVNPGVDTTNKVLLGPWSEPTAPVTVPADVATYVWGPGQDARRADVVSFQVVRWDPAKGQTVIKNDDAAPGHLIGEFGGVQYPSSEGTGPEQKAIDFNSRSFVLDVTGGRARTPDIGGDRTQYQVPIVAMVAQPDGSVVVRSQWRDKGDEVRRDMEENYNQAIKDSGRKREAGGPAGSRGGGTSSSM